MAEQDSQENVEQGADQTEDNQQDSGNEESKEKKGPDRLIVTVIVLAVLGLAFMVFFGLLYFYPEWFPWTSAANPEEDTGVAETAIVQTLDEDGNSVEIFIPGGDLLSIPLDPPETVTVANKQLTSVTEFVSPTGEWATSSAGGEVTEWVYGTIINYVFGLPGSAENEDLLQNLVPGDPLTVQTRNGVEKEFIITGRELTNINNASLFEQNRPGITLIWLDDAEETERLVVYGDYVLPDNEGNVEPRNSVEIGETAQLSDVRMTALGSTQSGQSAGLPPGFNLFIIDYELENIGANSIDTGSFRFVLVDEQGNQYSLNAVASQEGTYPLIGGIIEPGSMRQASAGYQIPANLSSDTLRWQVERIDTPGRVEVVIPFGGNTIADAVVILQNAEVSTDGTSLILTGQVTNSGSQPLVISEADIELSNGGTVYLVFSTTPAFPWTIGSGESLPFALSFQRPTTEAAAFTVLNQSFELRGLR